MTNIVSFIPETGRQIGRISFFSIRDEDGWIDFGIAIDAKITGNFSFCEIAAKRDNIHFPESRRIQEFIGRRIGDAFSTGTPDPLLGGGSIEELERQFGGA